MSPSPIGENLALWNLASFPTDELICVIRWWRDEAIRLVLASSFLFNLNSIFGKNEKLLHSS